MPECKIVDCEKRRDYLVRGMCTTHYRRWSLYGDPLYLKQPQKHGVDRQEAFWEYVDASGDCWLWLSSKTKAGYGAFWLDGQLVYAHRHAYESLVGPIPAGYQIDHLCRVKACVNPDHLEPMTIRDHARRSNKVREYRKWATSPTL